MADRIKLQAVLAEINQFERDGDIHVFSLGYVKTNGQTGTKPKCRKAGSNYAPPAPSAVAQHGRSFYNIKEKGVIMLVDHTTDQIFSLKIRLLTHYNGRRIQH